MRRLIDALLVGYSVIHLLVTAVWPRPQLIHGQSGYDHVVVVFGEHHCLRYPVTSLLLSDTCSSAYTLITLYDISLSFLLYM